MTTLLIVDDDRDILLLLQVVFQLDDYKILLAANGLDALEIAENEHVDVVLADLDMPQITGPKLVERLRKIHPDIKVVYISAHIAKSSTDPPMITKPFDPYDLRRVVATVVGG